MQTESFLILACFFTAALAGLGDPCSGPSECASVSNSVCDLNLGQCVCDARYVPTNDGICVGVISSACIIDHGKTCSSVPYALCSIPSLLTCDCTKGYLMSEDRTSCYTPAAGGHCLDNAQCLGLGAASCVDEKCACDAGHIKGPSGNCFPIAEGLFTPCSNDAQCEGLHPSAFCEGVLLGKECRCSGDFVENAVNSNCVQKAYQIGDSCEVATQCREPNSRCSGGACLCNSGYVVSIDGVNCIPSSSLGGSCFQGVQCPSGSCIGGLCV